MRHCLLFLMSVSYFHVTIQDGRRERIPLNWQLWPGNCFLTFFKLFTLYSVFLHKFYHQETLTEVKKKKNKKNTILIVYYRMPATLDLGTAKILGGLWILTVTNDVLWVAGSDRNYHERSWVVSVPGLRPIRSEESRVASKEQMDYNVMSTEALSDLWGSPGAGNGPVSHPPVV